MKTLLVDGDMVAWLAALGGGDVKGHAVNAVRKYIRLLSADRAIICLSDPTRTYYKHYLFPGYKPHRPDPPLALPMAFDALKESFKSRTVRNLEADDVIGILATHPAVEGEKICVAVDKDMLTIPGRHWNPRGQTHGIVEVSERDADFNHMRQAIVGDSTDGFPGCPRVGPAKVGRILWGEPRQWWGQLVLAFKNAGKTQDDALLQCRLARICRYEDYDFERNRVILWTPKMMPVAVGA